MNDFLAILLAALAGSGLFLVFFKSPALPHFFWLICGRGKGEEQWSRDDFETYVSSRFVQAVVEGQEESEGNKRNFLSRISGLFWSFFYQLWHCPYCQAFHCGWIPGLYVWVFSGSPLWLLPVFLLAPPAIVHILNRDKS